MYFRKDELGKKVPTIDKDNTRSHGRNRKSRRHATPITAGINLEVYKATSKNKTMKEQDKNRIGPHQKHKLNWEICNTRSET